MSRAREIAVSLLDQVQTGETTLDRLMDASEPRIRLLSRPDRALYHALVYGVLRWQGRLDWIIHHLASQSSRKIDPMVHVILRLGVYQILFMDRIPSSAAVHTSVELTKKFNKKWAGGFTNAILRNLIRHRDNIPWPDRESDPVRYLAAVHAFPTWLISRWVQYWGFENTEQMCRSINEIPAVTLRVNSLKISRSELMRKIAQEVQNLNSTAHSPEGIHLTSLKRPLRDWPAYKTGLFQVQSEAAQLMGYLLAPQPGERIWDVCAGLGTKTAHLAQLMDNRGHIMASDLNTGKLKALNREMARLAIDIVKTCPMDAIAPPAKIKSQRYDRILVDAPCSGLGVLQKNPDGKWHTGLKDIQRNRHKQQELLSAAATYLKPDGVLVYCVCSVEPEENEMVVEHFLQKHPEFGIYCPDQESTFNFKLLRTPEGFLRTSPHQHEMDGFFAAAFKRLDGNLK